MTARLGPARPGTVLIVVDREHGPLLVLGLVDPPRRLAAGEDHTLRATLSNLSGGPVRLVSEPSVTGLLLPGHGGSDDDEVVGGGGWTHPVGREYRLTAGGSVDLTGGVSARRSSVTGPGGPPPSGPYRLVVRLTGSFLRPRRGGPVRGGSVPVRVSCPTVPVEVVARHSR